jgi:hypothetical protein
MSVVGDRCEADPDTEEVVGPVQALFRQVREALLHTKWLGKVA